MDECLKTGTFTIEQLENLPTTVRPTSAGRSGSRRGPQVAHWMDVLAGWKTLLGKDWEQTYAASNTIYVTRQNNILFTVLAQFMGEEAIGNRLLLLETTEFTTTPEKMLDLLGRIVSDRALGQLFFRDYYLMDAELLGGGGRKVIAEEATRRGMKPLLPPAAPFYSNEWPWKTDPKKGKGPEDPRRSQVGQEMLKPRHADRPHITQYQRHGPDYFISSLEIVSPPLRVHILLRTSLLICDVTGRTLPSQKPKLTALGCLLAQ